VSAAPPRALDRDCGLGSYNRAAAAPKATAALNARRRAP